MAFQIKGFKQSGKISKFSGLADKMGNTPCIGPYNTSYLHHVMLSYVIYIVVYIILYCNDDWCVKDGVVHCSRQQSLIAKWLGLCVNS